MFTHNEDAKQYCVSSHNLYNVLIAPFENDLHEKHLTIIPDGKLNYISFDGLLKTLPDTSETIRFNELNYLVKDVNINYANSVNIFLKNKASKPKLRNQTLAFAPEYNSEEFKMTGTSYKLAPLPGVQKEVDEIAKSVNTTIFRSKDASEQNFREKSGNFDILHLAMHAYINDSLPAYSRLAFSQIADTTTLDNDGWLNTADIYNLDLNASMTVLSACNTGVGKLQKGEGLMSLARGFLYAGCPSVVMSLWEVEDAAGTKIMTSFYKYLKAGKTKDEALRLAKLKYLEESNSRLSHPHYWMSFKCIGDNSPVYTSYDLYFFAILILLIIAFSIDQGIRIKKARRNRQA
jgi:CHAT domain-containing protein